MASAYYSAVLKNLPNAKHVFDRFHIVKLMNDKLTQLRRDLQREADMMGKKVLKGLRFLLLKHQENLDEAKNERARLMEALDLNQPLAIAYYLGERQKMNYLPRGIAGRIRISYLARVSERSSRLLSSIISFFGTMTPIG